MTGLSIDTLRAWERRYQAVVPERSDRGRQYTPVQIERLLVLGQLVRRGHAISSLAALPDPALLELLERAPTRADVEPKGQQGLIQEVLCAIENYDVLRANEELERLAAVIPATRFVYQVVLPLMQEVGTRWHEGALGVAQEHLTTQMVRNLLGSMMRLFRPSYGATKIVLATPSGESHELGILAAAMLAALSGIEPLYLGPDLPSGEIAGAATKVGARVVLLGISTVTAAISEEIRAVAAAIPETAQLWLGGAGTADFDFANMGINAVVIKDLPTFEIECRRWRTAAVDY